MKSRLLIAFTLLLGVTAYTSMSQVPEAAESSAALAGSPFLALHLYNPVSDEANEQFLGFVSELNAAVASTGLSDTKYRVWKVTGEQSGDYGYLFGSTWADRATYDAVHEHDAYRAAIKRIQESGAEFFAAEVYNRYTLVNPASTEIPPMPGDGPTYLTMHLLTFDSEAEAAQYAAILEAGSAAIASAGHPETRYALWKISGEQTGEYNYLSGSLWVDKATYDAVHEHADYQAFGERHGSAYQALVEDQIYNRYERVPVK